jgi:solute carrier family 8 (sodium/calcium exchanger)
LTFSVAVYTAVSFVCLGVLFMRRYMKFFGRGELGGPALPKYGTTILFVFLWIVYIVLSALQAYGHLPSF